jgi:hypothetical protein
VGVHPGRVGQPGPGHARCPGHARADRGRPAQGRRGTFTIPTADAPGHIVLRGLPNLVHTRGSAYCLLPGMGGLRYLASLSGPNGGTP